jgi:hypothetical protein
VLVGIDEGDHDGFRSRQKHLAARRDHAGSLAAMR